MLRVAAASANCISGSKAGKGWSGAHRTLLAFEGLREEKEGGKPCAAALSIGGCAAAGGGCAGSPRQELRPRCYPPAAQSSLCCRAARGLGAAAHWGTELRQRLWMRRGYPEARRWQNTVGLTESAQVSPASAGSAWFVCLLGSEPSESQLRLTQDTVSPDCRA